MLHGRLTPVTVWGGRILAGFCVLAGIVAVALGISSGRPDISDYLPFAGLLLMFQWRKTFSDIADEVLIDGDALLIRDRGKLERVPLTSVSRVDFSWRKRHGTSKRILPVISLTLRDTTKLGDEATFVARTDKAISASAQEAAARELVEDLRNRSARA